METDKITKKTNVRAIKKSLDKNNEIENDTKKVSNMRSKSSATNKGQKTEKPDEKSQIVSATLLSSSEGKDTVVTTSSVRTIKSKAKSKKDKLSKQSKQSKSGPMQPIKENAKIKQAKSKQQTARSNKTNKINKNTDSDEPIDIDNKCYPKLTTGPNGIESSTTQSTDSSNDKDKNNIINPSNFVNDDFPLSKLLLNYDIDDEKRKDAEEDIMKEDLFRLAIKPIDPKYKIIWDLYKKQHEAMWTAEEVDFSNDRHDFLKLNPDIQHFIKLILAFFAGADSIVNINIRKKFSKITVKEAEVTYGFQQMMENIHGEVYSDMLINIITDPVERVSLMHAYKNVESIKRMIQWAQRWIESERRIGFSIVVFCIFEGLMFSGAFASIYWLKKLLGEDKMKGLTQSNNLIAKDEGMHTNYGCVMYDYVIHKLTSEEIYTLITEAVDICKLFTKDAIRVDMIGMNVNLMHQYIEYVADRLLVCLGYEKYFNTIIPDQFQFMDTIGFMNKDNFFERRATEYQKAYSDRNRADWTFKVLKIY